LGAGAQPTLQSLIDAAAPGATVKVTPGVYREVATITKPLTLDGGGQATITGADVVTGWTSNGGYWTIPTPPLPFLQGQCESAHPLCSDSHQVIRDGTMLTLVSGKPASGQFSNDGKLLWIADNPNGHTLEVTTRTNWLHTAADGVTIRGFTMRYAGPQAQQAAVAAEGHSNWTLIGNTITGSGAGGVTSGTDSSSAGAHVTIQDNDISNSGQWAIASLNTTDLNITGNVIHGNNTHGYDPLWEAGGTKFNHVTGTVIANNESYGNDGPGLWVDINSSYVGITGNFAHDNTFAGVMYEVSSYGNISGNRVSNNGWDSRWGWKSQIQLSSDGDITSQGNVYAWGPGGVVQYQESRSDKPADAGQNITVSDNVDANGVPTPSLVLRLAGLPAIQPAHP
jgi:parallel beta-helix repeat protein